MMPISPAGSTPFEPVSATNIKGLQKSRLGISPAGSIPFETSMQSLSGQMTSAVGPAPKQEAVIEPFDLTTKKGLLDGFSLGFDDSVPGLIARGEGPRVEDTSKMDFWTRQGYNAGVLIGDLPLMVLGGAIGAGAGAVVGGSIARSAAMPLARTALTKVGTEVAASGAAFALPTSTRQALVDSYERGEVTNFPEFIDRSVNALTAGGLSFGIGATTGLAGKAVPGMMKLPTEITALTALSSAAEGHVPTLNDFADNAILIGGMRVAVKGGISLEQSTRKLLGTYKRYGFKPNEIKTEIESITDKGGDLDQLINQAVSNQLQKQDDVVAFKKLTSELNGLTNQVTQGGLTPFKINKLNQKIAGVQAKLQALPAIANPAKKLTTINPGPTRPAKSLIEMDKIFLETEAEIKVKAEAEALATKQKLVRAVLDSQGNVKSELRAKGGLTGEVTVRLKVDSYGAHGYAADLVAKRKAEIVGDLSPREIQVLNWLQTSARESINIKNNIDAIAQAKAAKQAFINTGDFKSAKKVKIPKERLLSKERQKQDYDRDQMYNFPARAGASASKLADRHNKFADFTKKLLDDSLEEGFITPKEHRDIDLKSPFYARTDFVDKYIDPVTQHPETGAKVRSSGMVHVEQGSESGMMVDTVKQIEELTLRAEVSKAANRANKALMKLALDNPNNGLVQMNEFTVKKDGTLEYSRKKPVDMEYVFAWKDGQRHEMLMPKEMAAEWQGLDPLFQSGLADAIEIASGAKLTRFFATGPGQPFFWLTDLPKNAGRLYFKSDEYSAHLPVFAGQLSRDLAVTAKAAFTKKGPQYEEFSKAGLMKFMAHEGKVDAGKTLNQVQAVTGKMNETAELWTRMALYERAIRNGRHPLDAAYESRNVLDFHVKGQVAAVADRFVPYTAVAINGTRGMIEAAINNPGKFAYKSAQMLAFSMAVNSFNRMISDSGYDQVPQYDKNNYVILMDPTGPTKNKDGNDVYAYTKIGLDPAQALFNTIGNASMDKLHGKDVDVENLIETIGNFLNTKQAISLPATTKAALAYYMNKDFWSNKEYWTGREVNPSHEIIAGETVAPLRAIGAASAIAHDFVGTPEVSPARLQGALGGALPSNPLSAGAGTLMRMYMDQLPDGIAQAAMEEFRNNNLPSIRRVYKFTTGGNPEEFRKSKEVERALNDLRQEQDLTIQEIGLRPGRKPLNDVDILATEEAAAYIKSQPKQDQERLVAAFERTLGLHDVPLAPNLLDIANQPIIAKAYNFHRIWTSLASEDTAQAAKFARGAKNMPGFWSDEFNKELGVVISAYDKGLLPDNAKKAMYDLTR